MSHSKETNREATGTALEERSDRAALDHLVDRLGRLQPGESFELGRGDAGLLRRISRALEYARETPQADHGPIQPAVEVRKRPLPLPGSAGDLIEWFVLAAALFAMIGIGVESFADALRPSDPTPAVEDGGAP